MAQELKDTSLYADANLKAYYRFEAGSLTTDSSAGGHTLTAVSDPAEGVGKFGGGVDLDSDDAFTAVDHADFKPTSSFSVGAWVKTTTQNKNIFTSFGGSGNYAGWNLAVQGDKARLASYKNSGTTENTDWKAVDSTTVIVDGLWRLIIGTWDGASLKIYVNGVLENTSAWANAPAYKATNYVMVGAFNTGSVGGFLTGSLDDVFLLNGTALTAAQVANLYDRGIKKINGVYMGSQEIASTRFAGDANLRAYYRFNTGALTTDSSGNGYTLTNNNTVADGTGKFGGGADFGTGNTNKSLSRTDALGTTQNEDKTISLWIKMNTELSGGDAYKNIANLIYTANDINYYIDYHRISGVNRVAIGTGRVNVAGYETEKVFNLGTSTFHHLVLTYTTSTAVVRGYLDGDYFGQATRGAGDGNSVTSDGFSINPGFMDMVIDDVGVYNRVFTSDEIYSLYKTGVKKLNGVVNLNPELESSSLRGDANLVQYTRFEGNSTATVGSNGTDTDMTYGATYGKMGQGALFNGTSSKIVTGNCNIGTRFTVSVWIKADGNQILYSRVIENDYANGGFAISAKSTTTWDAGVNGTTLTTFPPIKNGVWNHLALVYNGASITLYSDGVPYSVASTTDPTKTNIPLYVGEYVGGGNYYFKGSMDDLAVFSRALTAQEISNLYNTNIKKYMGISNI